LRRAGAQEIADDNEARRDADSAGKLAAISGVQRRNRGRQFEPGHDGALGFALLRLRIPEIDEHPVAHVLGDKPAEAVDRFGDGAMISADHLAQILGIEPRGKRRRGYQIAKHHGQLPTLGTALWRCIGARRPNGGRSRGCGRCSTKRGDSVEQPPAMPDQGDTEILQILGRQADEHFFVDLIIAECLVVTLKTKAAQPYRYVHPVILGSRSGNP
jgi:hypothetical protein